MRHITMIINYRTDNPYHNPDNAVKAITHWFSDHCAIYPSIDTKIETLPTPPINIPEEFKK